MFLCVPFEVDFLFFLFQRDFYGQCGSMADGQHVLGRERDES